MKPWKAIDVDFILTKEEKARAKELLRKTTENFNTIVVNEIIAPNINRINTAIGQENDPKYLGYAVEHSLRFPNKVKTKKAIGIKNAWYSHKPR